MGRCLGIALVETKNLYVQLIEISACAVRSFTLTAVSTRATVPAAPPQKEGTDCGQDAERFDYAAAFSMMVTFEQ